MELGLAGRLRTWIVNPLGRYAPDRLQVIPYRLGAPGGEFFIPLLLAGIVIAADQRDRGPGVSDQPFADDIQILIVFFQRIGELLLIEAGRFPRSAETDILGGDLA